MKSQSSFHELTLKPIPLFNIEMCISIAYFPFVFRLDSFVMSIVEKGVWVAERENTRVYIITLFSAKYEIVGEGSGISLSCVREKFSCMAEHWLCLLF